MGMKIDSRAWNGDTGTPRYEKQERITFQCGEGMADVVGTGTFKSRPKPNDPIWYVQWYKCSGVFSQCGQRETGLKKSAAVKKAKEIVVTQKDGFPA